MARGRGNRVITGAGKPRKNKDWYGAEAFGALGANTVARNWLVLPSIVHPMHDPTAMAVEMYAAFGAGEAVTAGSTWAIGVYRFAYTTTGGVASDALPDLAAVQSPLADPDTDWVWRWIVPLVAQSADFADNTQSRDTQVSRAMRKLGNNESLLVVVAAAVISSTFHWHGRALLGE